MRICWLWMEILLYIIIMMAFKDRLFTVKYDKIRNVSWSMVDPIYHTANVFCQYHPGWFWECLWQYHIICIRNTCRYFLIPLCLSFIYPVPYHRSWGRAPLDLGTSVGSMFRPFTVVGSPRPSLTTHGTKEDCLSFPFDILYCTWLYNEMYICLDPSDKLLLLLLYHILLQSWDKHFCSFSLKDHE